uniref:AB hydrolase-1 domain-containing protein n=2 Tax=Corethron hystrix TaxID=216773 RepID=A0A7S1BI14_9STRA|mmetsp:Transcript_26318/g.60618  ORF Transcript_26318/g.60618 Transcript_26318/m.60618 type:complete len:165 (+) Transcript_26318:792-1286(+)
MDIAPVRYSESSDPSWANIRSIIDAMQSIDFSGSKRDADQLLRSHIDDLALRAFVLTNLEDLRESGGVRWKINIGAISRRLHEIADFDIFSLDDDCLSDDHPVYHGDTFYINGGVSRYVRHSHMPTIGQLFPNHMLTTVRGAGHWVHAEAPDDTIALLKTYLER